MSQETTNKPNEKAKKASFGAIVADHKAEFKRIVWPKKDDVAKKTVTVIFTSLLISLIIFCYDTVFTGAIEGAMSLLGLI